MIDEQAWKRKGRRDAEAVLDDLIERGDFEGVIDLLGSMRRLVHQPRLPGPGPGPGPGAGSAYLAGAIRAMADLVLEIKKGGTK